MLFRPRAEEFIEREWIDTAPLPDDGQELLKMMWAERSTDRHDSMREVQE